MSNFRLDKRVAIVTGGASGIGQAIAETFAANGAFVHILDLNVAQGAAVVAAINAQGGKASAHACDVSNQTDVQQTVAEITCEHPLNILVNNAGIAHIGKLETTSDADFERVFRVNVKGVYHCMYACIESLKANGGGVILNLASIAASVGLAERFAYSMSKAAVRSMTFSVARDYVADQIRCNCISPARVHTPFVDGFLRNHYPGSEAEMFEKLSQSQPLGRMATTQEVAHLALYLCSDEAAFITGCDYPIDGGFFNLHG
ncbi:MAG: SDR family oxidoreductase [Acidobacteria bacterium]|nr:SDR family oxidoreductase [Acidobacteriota bacterium]